MKQFIRDNYIAAVFDLDGTVLQDGEMSAPVAAALRRLKDSGIKTAIGSGRGFSQISAEIRELFNYTICANGGMITDNTNGNVIYSAPFSPEMVDRVVETAREYGGDVFCFLKDWMLGTEYSLSLMRRGLPLGEQSCYRTSGDDCNVMLCKDIAGRIEQLGEYPCKMQAFPGNPDDCEQIREKLTETGLFTVLNVGSGVLEITGAGISKGTAITMLENPQKTVAFGDSINDMAMLENSGYAVVMANGSPDVKSIADFIACDVRLDGVAQAIKELFDI